MNYNVRQVGSLRQNVSQGLRWSIIQHTVNHMISFSIFSLLARLLQPEDFGLVALAGVFITFIYYIQDLGLTAAIVQRDALEQEHLDSAFWSSLGIGLALTLSGIAFSGLIAEMFQQPRLKAVLRCMSLCITFSALSQVQMSILRRKLAVKVIAVRSATAGTISGIVGIALAFSGFGIWSLVARQLMDSLIGTAILWNASNWRPRFRFSMKHLKDLLGFGFNMMGSSLLAFLHHKADAFLIGYFLGPVALGYYTVAFRIIGLMTQVLSSIAGNVVFPAFSRVQKQMERLRSMVYTTVEMSTLIGFPAFLGLFALTPNLVPVLFGEQWEPSVPVMQVLTLFGAIHSATYFHRSLIISASKPSWNLGLHIAGAIGSIVGLLIAVRWGLVAIAASFVIVNYLIAPISFWLMHMIIGLDIKKYLFACLPASISSAAMLLIIYALKICLTGLVPSNLLIIINISSGIISYFVIIQITAPSLLSQVRNFITDSFLSMRRT